jgi:hypothetical protein
MTEYNPNEDIPDIPYDTSFDEKMDKSYEEIKEFLKSKQTTKDWASAKICELYYFGKGFTIESLAEHIGCSKSTVFLHIKKMRLEINEKLQNPFDIDEEE